MAPSIQAAGGDLVIIGSGTPEQAKTFAEEESLGRALGGGREIFVVTDPTLEAYRRAGMKRGLLATLAGFGNGLRAFRAGHRQGLTKGDPWQQGGVVVVSSLAPERLGAGKVVLQHAADAAGEPTDFGHVVEAVARAAAL